MNCIYVVMYCRKGSSEGLVSQDAYSTLEGAQAFCVSRFGVKKIADTHWASAYDDYYIKILNVK